METLTPTLTKETISIQIYFPYLKILQRELIFDTMEEKNVFLNSLIPLLNPFQSSISKTFVIVENSYTSYYYKIEDNINQLIETNQLEKQTKKILLNCCSNYKIEDLK